VTKLLLAAAQQDAAAAQAVLQRPPMSLDLLENGAWAVVAGVLMDMVLEAAAAVDTKAQQTAMQSMLVCVAGMQQQDQREEPQARV